MKFETITHLARALDANTSRFYIARTRHELFADDDGFFDTDDRRNVPYIAKVARQTGIPFVEIFSPEVIDGLANGKYPNPRLCTKAKIKQPGRKQPDPKYNRRGKPSLLDKAIAEAEEAEKKKAKPKPKRKRSTKKKTGKVVESKQEKPADVPNDTSRPAITKDELMALAARKSVAEAKLKEENLERARLQNEKTRGNMIEKSQALRMYEITFESIKNAMDASTGKNIGERYNTEAKRLRDSGDRDRVFRFNEIHAQVVQETWSDAMKIFEENMKKLEQAKDND